MDHDFSDEFMLKCEASAQVFHFYNEDQCHYNDCLDLILTFSSEEKAKE